MGLDIGVDGGYLKLIPSWIWKSSIGYIIQFCKKKFGVQLEWEVWDESINLIEGCSDSVIVFRVSNKTHQELQNICFELELIRGDPCEISIAILPLQCIAGQMHMDKIIFDELTVQRKPYRRSIQFDLPSQTHWRVELKIPFSMSGLSPISYLKYYMFSCRNTKTRRNQRFG